MYDLTQLEQAGYQFTPLERLVFENPSFQFLYARWPIKWGRLTTGLTAEVSGNYEVSFKPADREKLAPHAAGTFFDEMSSHIRSVSILAAKVARDSSADELDQGLLRDLSFWLDKSDACSYQPFRWVKFERDHLDKLRREARLTEVAALSQGNANVVVLLLGELSPSCRKAVRDAVMADCIRRKIFDRPESTSRHAYHFPWPLCQSCEESARGGGRHDCNSPNSVVLVDCGDVPAIIKSVPSDVRRVVKPVRFTVPKSTFADNERHANASLSPRLFVFSLQMFSEKDQRNFQSELEQGLLREQAEAKRGGYRGLYSNYQVIAPARKQKPNALLLAGISRTDNWRCFLKGSNFFQGLEKTIRVDLIGG